MKLNALFVNFVNHNLTKYIRWAHSLFQSQNISLLSKIQCFSDFVYKIEPTKRWLIKASSHRMLK